MSQPPVPRSQSRSAGELSQQALSDDSLHPNQQSPISRPSQRTREVLSKSAAEISPFQTTSDNSERERLQIGVFPKPLVVEPVLDHRQTFVLLHGRGGNAIEFGYNLLAMTVKLGHDGEVISSHNENSSMTNNSSTSEVPTMQPRTPPIQATFTLREAFPHAKFIFPTAAPLRARLFGRKPIFQWMDNWPLSSQEIESATMHVNQSHQHDRDDSIQVPGLQASTKYIHGILQSEIALVGADNVALGGLSQGCACALISLLTWQGPNLPVVFGMCGWLPFAQALCEVIEDAEASSSESDDHNNDNGNEDDDDDDLFERDPIQSHQPQQTPAQQMISELYSLLEQPVPDSIPTLSTPVFLGHGTHDEKVPVGHGAVAAQTMAKIVGCESPFGTSAAAADGGGGGVGHVDERHAQVQYKTYDELGHWYSSEMLGDIVDFIKSNTSWAD